MIIRREIKVLLTLLIPVLMSCNGSQDKNILIYTDTLLVEDPKQALSILDSLDNAGTLNEKNRMHLVWNRAMAHQALGMSLAEDDQLTEAIAYYRAQKEKLADSYLLEASYLSWMDKPGDAIRTIDKGMTEIAAPTKIAQLPEAKDRISERERNYNQPTQIPRQL